MIITKKSIPLNDVTFPCFIAVTHSHYDSIENDEVAYKERSWQEIKNIAEYSSIIETLKKIHIENENDCFEYNLFNNKKRMTDFLLTELQFNWKLV